MGSFKRLSNTQAPKVLERLLSALNGESDKIWQNVFEIFTQIEFGNFEILVPYDFYAYIDLIIALLRLEIWKETLLESKPNKPHHFQSLKKDSSVESSWRLEDDVLQTWNKL